MKEQEYKIWSEYEQVKGEIMWQHSLLIDQFNEFRMLIATGRGERAHKPYYEAGKALVKLKHYCIMSGAWDKDLQEVQELIPKIDGWISAKFNYQTLKLMADIEKKIEEWFTKTGFYDIRIMKNDPGMSIKMDKSY